MEAAVSGSRRVILISAGLALAVAALLMAIVPVDATAQAAEVSVLAGLALGSALLYGTAVGFGAERIARGMGHALHD